MRNFYSTPQAIRRVRQGAVLLAGLCFSAFAQAQICPYRGDLDEGYCDANRDLVADSPVAGKNPDRLIVGVSSVEDAQTAMKTYSPLIDHLKTCLKKDVQLHPPVGESNVLEGMRTGQVHVGQFATGATMYAVNFAGGVPFAGKGPSSTGKRDTYTLMLIVKADSSYQKPSDLKGKQIAHTSATSNSGNLAPRALFPELGLTPEKDYKVVFSGKHDKSIMGVQLGLYDAAAVASDVFERLIAKGDIKRNQFRVVYESEEFPPDAFSYAHDLDPKLAGEIKRCFYDFRFPESMSKQLENNDRFFPVDYAKDWKLVRLIAKASGTQMSKAAYQAIVTAKKK
jgi:phosphonate transport system substrate-binding protein